MNIYLVVFGYICLVAAGVILFLLWETIRDFMKPQKACESIIANRPSVFTKKSFLWYSGYVDFQRRRRLKTFISLALMVIMLGACTSGQSPIKIDGQVDEVEASLIKVAVGVAMSGMPETIIPAYAISTALMQSNLNVITSVADLDTAISIEVKKLNLTKEEEASFMDLVMALKAGIRQRLGGTPGYDHGVVIRAVIEIVNSAAKARLPVDNADITWVDDSIAAAAERTNASFGIPKDKNDLKVWMVEHGFLLSDNELRKILP
jgi:hypothetical protein